MGRQTNQYICLLLKNPIYRGLMEAPSRFELLNEGFADPSLSHLGTAPVRKPILPAGSLFADAEVSKHALDDFVGGCLASDSSQSVQRAVKVDAGKVRGQIIC